MIQIFLTLKIRCLIKIDCGNLISKTNQEMIWIKQEARHWSNQRIKVICKLHLSTNPTLVINFKYRGWIKEKCNKDVSKNETSYFNQQNINWSSSKDIELFLEDERRAQEEVLQSNALKIDELENIINSNNSKLLIWKENADLKTKLNLLNVINNDRVATQVIESDEGSNPNEDSRETW